MAYDNPRPSSQPVGSIDLAVAKDDLITLDLVVNEPSDSVIINRKGKQLTSLDGLGDELAARFEPTFSSQFAFKRIGNISLYVGQQLQDADRLNAYQYPDDSGEWYAPIQSQTFPIIIPANPASSSDWSLISAINEIAAIARSLNALDSQIIYSTDTTTALDDILYIYDAVVQKVWLKPLAVGSGESIVSVVDSTLTTSAKTYELVNAKYKPQKTKLAFIFDDAHRSHYTTVLPLFEARKLKLALAISPRYTDEIQQSGTRMTTGEILDAQERGVELINHQMTHRPLSVVTSVEVIKAESETSRQWLEDRSINVTGFLAASSQVNQDLLAPLYATHSYAMTVASANNFDVASIGDGDDPYTLSRWSMDGTSSALTINAIKQAISSGRSLIMYDHDVPASSAKLTRLTEVLDFIEGVGDDVEVVLPKDLTAYKCGTALKQSHYKTEKQIFNSTDGWAISGDLGAVITQQEITLTPTVSGPKTMTRDVFIDENKTYTFSANIRSASTACVVSMGVHYLNASNVIISGYSLEGSAIEYDNLNFDRYYLTSHAPRNAVKARIFFRVNVTAIDSVPLIIREPAVYTGTRVLFESEYIDTTDTASASHAIDLSKSNEYFIRLDNASTSILTPTNGSDLDEITFYLRANGVNRSIVWGSGYALNPNTVFNHNTTGNIMIAKFKFYRGKWCQVADTAWV